MLCVLQMPQPCNIQGAQEKRGTPSRRPPSNILLNSTDMTRVQKIRTRTKGVIFLLSLISICGVAPALPSSRYALAMWHARPRKSKRAIWRALEGLEIAKRCFFRCQRFLLDFCSDHPLILHTL